jgi:hypothetical protein
MPVLPLSTPATGPGALRRVLGRETGFAIVVELVPWAGELGDARGQKPLRMAADLVYLCPESHCQKNQRNGPCGGAQDGMCEVPGHTCVWADAYRRLKPYGEERAMLHRPPVLQDNDLRRTSAWANTFLGRDHYAQRAAEAALAAPPAAPTASHTPRGEG